MNRHGALTSSATAAAAAAFDADTAGDDTAAGYVYVNNMNTPHATVGLPERWKGGVGSSRHRTGQGDDSAFVGGARGGLDASRAAAAGSSVVQYSNHTTGAVATANRFGNAKAVEASPPPPPLDARSVHPNLEQVYTRIVRRLQRQINYEEIGRESLATQYGVAAELENSRHANAASKPVLLNSPDGGKNSVLEGSTELAQGADGSSRPGSAQSLTSAAGATHPVSGESMIVRYGRRQNRTLTSSGVVSAAGGLSVRDAADGTTTSPMYGSLATGGGESSPAAAALDDAEAALTLQPCPATLRLVVAHVQETVTNKMVMAERGSVKDCLRFTFECRALLDRLLKEVPTYSPIPDDVERLPLAQKDGPGGRHRKSSIQSNATSTAGGSHLLHELYQEFRKKPILLPRAQFVRDETTGAVGAELIARPATAVYGSSGEPGSAARPTFVAADRSQTSGVGLPGGYTLPVIAGPSAPAGDNDDGVALPATYGVSSRLLKRQASMRAAAAAETAGGPITAVTFPGIVAVSDDIAMSSHAMGPTAAMDRTMQMSATERDLSRAASSVCLPWLGTEEEGAGGHGAEPRTPGLSLAQVGRTASQSAMRSAKSRKRAAASSAVPAAVAAVNKVNASTMTDEHAGTVVTQAAYDQLLARATELENALHEARERQEHVSRQLADESGYTQGRQRVVQYLRETLLRECNVLRSQLAAAAHREKHLQHALRERAGAVDGVGGGGAPSMGLSVSAGRSTGKVAGAAGGGARRHGGLGTSFISLSGVPRSRADGGRGPLNGGGRSSDDPTADRPDLSHDASASASMTAARGVDEFGSGSSALSSTMPHVHAHSHPHGGGDGDSGNFLASDITSIQSLLDLVLLAVEKESVFTSGTGQWRTVGREVLASSMNPDAKHQADAQRAAFEQQTQRLRDRLLSQKYSSEHALAVKDGEIAHLRTLTNLESVEGALRDAIRRLRQEHRTLKGRVQEMLQKFQGMMSATTNSLLNRTKLMEQTASDNTALLSTQDALRALVESAHSLLLPMTASEYQFSGYHPWPAKLRSSTDPLASVIQGRYGPAEAVRLRAQLNLLSELYVALHKCVSRQHVLPVQSRPAAGEPLRTLCGRMALNAMCTPDIVMETRQRYDTELRCQRAIAKLNFKLMRNIYQQRTITERAVGAIVAAGMDPYTTTLPVARRVNALAAARGELAHTRAQLQKERMENARQMYRLWRSKGIDIFDGFAPPASSSSGGGGGSGMPMPGGAMGHARSLPFPADARASAAAAAATAAGTLPTVRRPSNSLSLSDNSISALPGSAPPATAPQPSATPQHPAAAAVTAVALGSPPGESMPRSTGPTPSSTGETKS